MKKRVKNKWLKALRSGEYKQGQDALNEDNKFCCLGVLCDLYIKEKKLKWDGISEKSLHDTALILPSQVVEWSGLTNEFGLLPKQVKRKGREFKDLTELNDTAKLSFKQIAQVIEKQF